MAVSANCARDQSTTLIRSFMIFNLDILSTCKVFPHGTGPVGVIVIVTLEQVGEEKQFEYQKKNSQFGKNEQPQGASHGHPAEPVDVKPPHLICVILDIHDSIIPSFKMLFEKGVLNGRLSQSLRSIT